MSTYNAAASMRPPATNPIAICLMLAPLLLSVTEVLDGVGLAEGEVLLEPEVGLITEDTEEVVDPAEAEELPLAEDVLVVSEGELEEDDEGEEVGLDPEPVLVRTAVDFEPTSSLLTHSMVRD